jgi:diguanylate cyclase (GGDEF)-like protein
MGSALRALIAAGCEDEAVALADGLRRVAAGFSYKWVNTTDALRRALAEPVWDVVLCDYALLGADAFDLLDAASRTEVPFIVVSQDPALDRAAELVRRGVRAFVARDDLGRLAPTVERELEDLEARRLRRRREAEVQHRADHVALTDLPNRRLLFDRLEHGMKRARRRGAALALLFVDLDRFKAVNDSMGHAAGDALLREAARRLESVVRESDTAARLGGDEFAVILDDAASAAGAESVARKVLESMARPFRLDGCEAHITASIGIALYPDDGEDAEALLGHADAAMYAVKDSGRNGYNR